MESVKKELVSEIEKISKKYKYHGFWKLGTAWVDNVSREENPYLYFPSEEYARKVLMEEFNGLAEDEFVPCETTGYLYFNEGDRLDIPFEIFKQKPEIHIDVPYDDDKPCGVFISCKRLENEMEVYGRLLHRIVCNAQQKYIKSLDC